MFGIEFLIIILVAWLFLGPKQMASVIRFLTETYQQLANSSKEVIQQMDVELARRQAAQVRAEHAAQVPPHDKTKLPDAYTRYKQDFPDEQE